MSSAFGWKRDWPDRILERHNLATVEHTASDVAFLKRSASAGRREISSPTGTDSYGFRCRPMFWSRSKMRSGQSRFHPNAELHGGSSVSDCWLCEQRTRPMVAPPPLLIQSLARTWCGDRRRRYWQLPKLVAALTVLNLLILLPGLPPELQRLPDSFPDQDGHRAPRIELKKL